MTIQIKFDTLNLMSLYEQAQEAQWPCGFLRYGIIMVVNKTGNLT
jgi:hypothetical protein